MEEDLFEEEAVFVAVPNEDGQVEMLEGRSEFESSISPVTVVCEELNEEVVQNEEFKPFVCKAKGLGLIIVGFLVLAARFCVFTKKQYVDQSVLLPSPLRESVMEVPSVTAVATIDSAPVNHSHQIMVAFYNPLHPHVRSRWDVWEDSAQVVNAIHLSPHLDDAVAVDCVMEEDLRKLYGVDVRDRSTVVWIKLLPAIDGLQSRLLSEGHYNYFTGSVQIDFQTGAHVCKPGGSVKSSKRIVAKQGQKLLPGVSSNSTLRVFMPTESEGKNLDEAHERYGAQHSYFNVAKALEADELVQINKVARALQLMSSKQLAVYGGLSPAYSSLIPVSTSTSNVPQQANPCGPFLKRRPPQDQPETRAFALNSRSTRMPSRAIVSLMKNVGDSESKGSTSFAGRGSRAIQHVPRDGTVRWINSSMRSKVNASTFGLSGMDLRWEKKFMAAMTKLIQEPFSSKADHKKLKENSILNSTALAILLLDPTAEFHLHSTTRNIRTKDGPKKKDRSVYSRVRLPNATPFQRSRAVNSHGVMDLRWEKKFLAAMTNLIQEPFSPEADHKKLKETSILNSTALAILLLDATAGFHLHSMTRNIIAKDGPKKKDRPVSFRGRLPNATPFQRSRALNSHNSSALIASVVATTTSPYPADPDIHFLTKDTFHHVIASSTTDVFVNFFLWFSKTRYSTTKKVQEHPISSPSWRRFASNVRALQLPVKIAALDCLAHMDFCVEQGVTRFPRHRWYYTATASSSMSSSTNSNSKHNSKGTAIHSVDFTNNKTADAFMQFAKECLGRTK